MDSIGDLLRKKADSIDASGIRGDLALIQDELDRLFEQRVKVARFDDNCVALLVTSSSVLASEVRLQQHHLMQNLNKALKQELKRFHIRIQ